MMDSKGNSLANLLEKISAPYIINYDFPALEGFVQEAIKDPDVAFAVFHDAAGKVLTQNSKVPSDTSALAVYKRDIKGQDGNTAAVLKIGYSKNTLSGSCATESSRSLEHPFQNPARRDHQDRPVS